MDVKSFIAGIAIGGLIFGTGTFFITKNICDKKNQEKIQTMRKQYKEKYAPKNIAVIKEDPSEIAERYSDEEKEEYKKSVLRYDPAETVNPSEDDDDEDDAPEEYYDDDKIDELMANQEAIEAMEYDKKFRNHEPTIISEEDFETGVPGFDNKEVSYYVDDDTYVYDDSDEVVDDPLYLFGRVIKNQKWDVDDDQTSEICIRNFNISTNFRITKNFCKYEI